MLNGADHYALPGLLSICERKLIEGLEPSNAAIILTLADQHGAVKLKRAALECLACNTAEVLRTKGWAHLSAARPALKDEAIGAMGELLSFAIPMRSEAEVIV